MPANRPLPGQAMRERPPATGPYGYYRWDRDIIHQIPEHQIFAEGVPDVDPQAEQFQQAFQGMLATPDEYYRWDRDQAIAKQNATARRQVSEDMFGMMQRQRRMEQRRAQEQQRRMAREMQEMQQRFMLEQMIQPMREYGLLQGQGTDLLSGMKRDPARDDNFTGPNADYWNSLARGQREDKTARHFMMGQSPFGRYPRSMGEEGQRSRALKRMMQMRGGE